MLVAVLRSFGRYSHTHMLDASNMHPPALLRSALPGLGSPRFDVLTALLTRPNFHWLKEPGSSERGGAEKEEATPMMARAAAPASTAMRGAAAASAGARAGTAAASMAAAGHQAKALGASAEATNLAAVEGSVGALPATPGSSGALFLLVVGLAVGLMVRLAAVRPPSSRRGRSTYTQQQQQAMTSTSYGSM